MVKQHREKCLKETKQFFTEIMATPAIDHQSKADQTWIELLSKLGIQIMIQIRNFFLMCLTQN